MKRRNNMFKGQEPDLECISLAWIIAKRVTHPRMKLDATIMVTGVKGSGKSMFCVSLANEIAKCIVIIKHRSELKKLSGKDLEIRMKYYCDQLFNMDHIKSVDKDGTMEMFSGDIIRTENAVLLCDDVSIAANARNSMTQNNKWLSQIMTVSRIFRNVVILNTVYSTLVDKTARNFSDIVVEMVGVDIANMRSIAKVYKFSVNQTTGKEYKEFFRFHNKRIKYWYCAYPPRELAEAYDKIREDSTNAFLDSVGKDNIERKEKGTKQAKKADYILNTYKDQVIDTYTKGGSIKECVRISPDLSEYWVNKIIGKYKQGVKNE